MDIKIRLDDETVAALDNMRIHDSPVPGRIVIKSRNDMVRTLIREGLEARQAAGALRPKAGVEQLAVAETRGRDDAGAGMYPNDCPYTVAELREAWMFGYQDGLSELEKKPRVSRRANVAAHKAAKKAAK